MLIDNAYLTFDGLAFTRYVPRGNGMFIVHAASHIRLLNLRMYGNPGANYWQDHYIYISSGSADILIDGSNLDGATGAAVQIGGGNGVLSSGVVIQNSRLANSGWGVISTEALGAVYKNDLIDGNAVAFHVAAVSTTTTTITNDTIRGPVGISVSPMPPAQRIRRRQQLHQLSGRVPGLRCTRQQDLRPVAGCLRPGRRRHLRDLPVRLGEADGGTSAATIPSQFRTSVP